MIIGFDAKRVFQNRTGLGNYSRTLLNSLGEFHPEHQYVLFAPKETTLLKGSPAATFPVVTPRSFPARTLPSFWRSFWITGDLKQAGIQLYHGLSNELPSGIRKTGIPSLVTIHDLIFERHPELYDRSEVWVYRKKFRQACRQADLIIATSEYTRRDIIDLYNMEPDKVQVGYQSCSNDFRQRWTAEALRALKEKYRLPEKYFLYVGSITARKNLLIICKALKMMESDQLISLVVVGTGKKYKEEVQQWLREEGLSARVIFLADTVVAADASYQSGEDLPGLYQQSLALIYPSMYEGFGIPLLEAMAGGTPVIAANATSLPEVGGQAALYFEPENAEELYQKMKAIAGKQIDLHAIKEMSLQQAALFTQERCAARVMEIYRSLR